MLERKPFNQFQLQANLLEALSELGYENATPIQEQSIPVLLKGRDLLAQAQTGTGKTAAFALPILEQLDISINQPQAIVIAPTRELAIQVAEAFQAYAKHVKGFHVLPIYGGQEYPIQLRALKRGAHVIVGTPGRVMDHLRRGTLSLGSLKTVILDEADEMLTMGFIEDIQWILEQIPQAHQTALFSATIPDAIKKVAKKYLQQPESIHIAAPKKSESTIDQSFMCISNKNKLDVLTRFLEVEDRQAIIVFVRTKNSSSELAERLQARGYAATALNGDMNQGLREKIVSRLKSGSIDIIVATSLAARGIDVDRISHVINYDIPYDAESYIHRIGRTGRAGRKGRALLFVTPREYHLLRDIQRAMPDNSIKQVDPPSIAQISNKRNQDLTEKVANVIEKSKKLSPFRAWVELAIDQRRLDPKDMAAALSYLMQQSNPMPSHEITSCSLEESPVRSRRSRRSPRRRGNDSSAPPRRRPRKARKKR